MPKLIDKIQKLIKREKTTPERKKDDSKKSSSEILSELFGAFNVAPPEIDDMSLKKSKKSKKEKKKRSRSSSTGDSESDHSYKRRKRKKKSKKRRVTRSPSYPLPCTPPRLNIENEPVNNISVKVESIKSKDVKIKEEKVKTEPNSENSKGDQIKCESPPEVQTPDIKMETSLIPMPESPKYCNSDTAESKKDNEKGKGKIQIKNLKFSTIFEETVKKAEEEARKKAEMYEEGEYTDSSSNSVVEAPTNSIFQKITDPGDLKTPASNDIKLSEEEKNKSLKSKNSSSTKSKASKRDRSKSRKRSRSRSRISKSRRSRSHSGSKRRRHRSKSKSRRKSRSRHRSRSRRRSRSRGRTRHGSQRRRRRSRSRSPSGVKLADSEKKRLLEVARRNAINMLKNGAVPAGAAALPPHTRNQVMAAIHSGGKSVDELTDFCKNLSKKEALGELSSVSSNENGMSDNEDTIAFHHPFLVKEKAPIVMNIRGGAPLPLKTSVVPVANKEELRLQFPVSSGSQHREKASEWVPVETPKQDMQVAKKTTNKPASPEINESAQELTPPHPDVHPPAYLKGFTSGSQLNSVPQSVPGPQAYPPAIVGSSNMDVASIVTQNLQKIRQEQEETELTITCGFGWDASSDPSLGQFTGSTGAQILTPRELASGTQAWAKKDQLVRAAPVEGGMGMHLLQKMGWTPGKGLGKEGTGTLQPLLLEVKLDTRGLQAKEEVSSRQNRGLKHSRGGRGRGAGTGGGACGGGGAAMAAGGKHPVSLLGEYCSKQKLGPPEYGLCFEFGPDHKKNFLFKVKVAGVEYQPAVASANKKQAKADAAQLALQELGIVT